MAIDTKGLATTEQWYREHASMGTERITQEDLPMPMLQLVQKSSNLQTANGEYPKFGKLFYTATKTEHDSFPCYILGAYTEMRPSYADKEVMQKVYVFIGIDATLQMPFKMIFRSTNVPVAKNFLGTVSAMKAPIFSMKVVFSSKVVEGAKGTYAVLVLSEKGLESNMEKLSILEKLCAKYVSVSSDAAIEEATDYSDQFSADSFPTETPVKAETTTSDSDLPF